jgi:hypothetical protein
MAPSGRDAQRRSRTEAAPGLGCSFHYFNFTLFFVTERISLLLSVASGPTLHSDNKNLRTDENIRAAELPIRIVSYTKYGFYYYYY